MTRTISLYNLLNAKNLLGFNMKSICFNAGLETKGYPSGLEYGWWKVEAWWNIKREHHADDWSRALVHALQGIKPSYNVGGHKYDDGQHAYRHCIKEVHWYKRIYRISVRSQYVVDLTHVSRRGRLGTCTFELCLNVGQWLYDANVWKFHPDVGIFWYVEIWYGNDAINYHKRNFILSKGQIC